MRIRKLILPVVAALASVLTVPVAASAATAHVAPASATAHVATPAGAAAHRSAIPEVARGCSGDACIWLSTPYTHLGTSVVDVHGCAWKSTVYGHIAISTPGGGHNSATKTWFSTSNYCTGGDDYYKITVTAIVGSYCSTTWNGSQFDGTACESVK